MFRFAGSLFCAVTLPVVAAGGDHTKDAKNWTPIKILGNPRAPEFVDIGEWINSEPVTMKGLKGKVVVVHFMAFG